MRRAGYLCRGWWPGLLVLRLCLRGGRRSALFGRWRLWGWRLLQDQGVGRPGGLEGRRIGLTAGLTVGW